MSRNDGPSPKATEQRHGRPDLGVRRRAVHEGPDPAAPTRSTAGSDATGRTDRLQAHMVGYAHLDPVWLWRWTEGYREARATLRSAVDRMHEFPEFVFTCTSVLFLEWVRESDPRLFAEITERVADGRFHVAGGWWIEPDCNLPSGESFVRQALEGQRWLAEHFGIVATVGANPDSFGHAATLPQLLRGAGLDGYVFIRPGRHEMDLPGSVFTWRGPDGSEVTALRVPRYNSDRDDLTHHVRECLAQTEPHDPLLMFYGVGNHGGGPTTRNLHVLRRIHATSPTVDLVCSTPRAYLDAVHAAEPELAVVDTELQHHARGCYSAHAGIKAWNRRAEAALAEAETWSTIAAAVDGLPYPHDDLRRAWRQVLFNQFHDTLAGSAIESAYTDARDQLGEALAIASRLTTAATARLSNRIHIDHEEDSEPIVVFNPHPWPVRQVVEHEVGGWAKRMDLVDDTGRPVPLQWGTSEALMDHMRFRAVFVADVPALGYRLYRLRLGRNGAAGIEAPAGPNVLENAHLRLELDEGTGAVRSFVRHASGVDLAPTGAVPAVHAEVLVDDADTWGHDRDRWDDVAGAFAVESIERVEHGAARTVVRVTSRYERSTLVEDYTLGRDDAYVDVHVTVDWHEPFRMLKLRYPTGVIEPTVTAETAYGAVVRAADGNEEPMQRWVDVAGRTGAGEPAGLAVANDGKYAYDVRTTPAGGDLGITVARSVPYAHHVPTRLPDRALRLHDQGEQRVRLRLIPHDGDWRNPEVAVARRAVELNEPVLAAGDTFHDGDLGGAHSFGALTGEHVAGFVLKRAEAGDATIVRVADTDGTGGDATVRLRLPLGRDMRSVHDVHVALRPAEVATVRIPDDGAEPVPVDLCEWADGERPPGQPTPDGRPHLPDPRFP